MVKEKDKGALPPTYESGIVEVVFKEDVRIHAEKVPAGAKKPWKLVSKAKIDIKSLDDFLRKIKCTRVVKTFTAQSENDYDELYKRVKEMKMKEKGQPPPNMNNFFTIHFPVTADPAKIAKELQSLKFVESAYPVPEAIPPNRFKYELLEEKALIEMTDLCRFMTTMGPCRISRIIKKPCTWSTPLDEPLVGTLDTLYTIDTVRNLENQWYIFRCNADSAWALACGAGVVIADIDWGYRTTHDDLKTRFDMSNAYNSYDGSNVVNVGGFVYHGTGVMGLAGAADNNTGMIGFAYGASLWPIQANTGSGPELGGNHWASAIDWVRARSSTSRKVIILEVQTGTFGNYEMIPSVNTAIISAIADNVVVCVAAGNGDRNAGTDDSGNPIPFTGSIVVGATEYDAATNPRAGFSNWGPRVDVAAPGDMSHDVTCSSTGDSDYRNNFGGTSGATPKVAGTAAMMLQCNPDLTPAEVRDIIRTTASATVVTAADRPVGGFLDTHAAVHEACRRADPCRFNLVVDHCKYLKVVDSCELAKMVDGCLKSNIILDPCRYRRIIGEGCIRDRIVIGPCCIRELIAGTPFWHDDVFEDWGKAYENLKNETNKHFKRITNKK